MSSNVTNFLEVGESDFKTKLLLNEADSQINDSIISIPPAGEWTPAKESKLLHPLPGFCLKTKNVKNDKIFINVIHSDEIAAPKDITDRELAEILSSDEASEYRVPMSLAEPHTDKDKSGKPCQVFDVLVNTAFFKKLETSDMFQTFLVTIILEGIEEKYETPINKSEWVVLKNKKYLGKTIPPHNVKNRLIQEVNKSSTGAINKPLITEMSPEVFKPEDKKAQESDIMIKAVSTKSIKQVQQKPVINVNYEIKKNEGERSLRAQFTLSDVSKSEDIDVDVGEDRLVIIDSTKGLLVDVFFPCNVDSEKASAEFNINTKILVLTLPLLG